MSVPFLSPGQTHAAVPRMKKALVRELQALGHAAIAQEINVDSTRYGPPAERGVRTLQKAKRLKVDGTVGKDTWAALGVHEPVVAIPRKDPKRVMASATNDFSTKEATIAAIKSECASQGLGLKAQIAYVLATVDHETAHTFKPVREAYWLNDPDAYLKAHHPDYYPYYGRGYVQLTWENNYRKYGQLVKRDLVGNPDLALDPQVALFVLVHGFKTGAFTGHKLADHVNAGKMDFLNARRCINGVDKQHEIAAIATKYLAQL
jgi:predicted chitinase